MTRARARMLGAVIAAVVVLAAAVVGGTIYRKNSVVEGSARDVLHLEGTWIRYSAEFAKRSKIEFAPCERGELSPVVTVTGTVSFDPERVAAIGARIPGRVRRVLKVEGDKVKAGEVIAEVESADLGTAQATVLAARAHADAASANETREKQLAEAHVSSQRDAELARAAAASARADLLAAEQKVRAMGGSAGAEAGILLLASPIAGKVVEVKVSRGQSVEASTTLARVADLSRVWIVLALFERELGRVGETDEVEIVPQTNAGKVVRGKVAHIGETIDLDTRSAPVRVVVQNGEGGDALRPGQSVLAKIHASKARSAALLVSREAITSVDGKPTVFVAHDATSVEPRSVTVGARDGARVEVLSGLTGGEQIVVSGVFALKSEVFR